MNWWQGRNGVTALVLILLVNSFAEFSRAGTIYVPSQQPTIQAGIDAAIEGDTVLVATGTYTGDGNRDIDFGGKNIVLKSEGGPEVTIIDCEGSYNDYHRGIYFHNSETQDAVFEGFTITNGYVYGAGGGISCRNSNPTIAGNIISGNQAYSSGFGGGASGGGISCSGSPAILNNMITSNYSWGAEGIGGDGGGISCGGNPLLQNNIIAGNGAAWGGVHGGGGGNGGAIKCYGGSPTIIGNTIVANLAGGAFWLQATLDFGQSTPTLHSNIIAYNNDAAISGENVSIACTNIFGNEGGDWTEDIASQAGIIGNFSADPFFCDTSGDNYYLMTGSPCLPDNNDCGLLIGALGVDCSSVVWYINIAGNDETGDGSSSNPFATIQRGIDAAQTGDIVLVAPGTYTGNGNRDIDFEGKNLLLKSETGPSETILDCEGTEEEPHRGLYFHSGEDSTAVVEGFAIINGVAIREESGGWWLGYGGAINCDSGSSPTITNNMIYGNWATYGGGIAIRNSDPIIRGNHIDSNSAYCNLIMSDCDGGNGGGLYCINSAANITGNILTRNVAKWGIYGGGMGFGAAIFCDSSCQIEIHSNTIFDNKWWDPGHGFSGGIVSLNGAEANLARNIIAFNKGDGLGGIDTSRVTIICCDIYGNTDGDWTGGAEGLIGVYGNFSANPLFCDTITDDYQIGSASPCAPDNNDEGILIGALGVGCEGGYLCGDATGDYAINVGDPVYLISHIYRGGPPPFAVGAGDANCDNNIDVGDAVYLINYIFKNGAEPCCP